MPGISVLEWYPVIANRLFQNKEAEMVVALSIVGGFAALFSLIMLLASYDLAADERSSGIAILSTVIFSIFGALFACALSMTPGTAAIITVAIVGGLATLGSLFNGLVACEAADRAGNIWIGICVSLVGALLVVATYVLALVHVYN